MVKKLGLYKLSLTIFFVLFITKPSFSAQKLTCATTHYPPYTVFNESTKTFSGSDIDIITPLFEQLKIDVKIINLPWARLKKEIKKNRYDCYFSVGKFEYREKFLEYSNLPTHITTIAIFYPKHGSAIDFKNKTVGVHRGINIHKNIPASYGLESAIFHQLPSNEVLFDMLQNGRIDAIVTSKVVGEYIYKNMEANFDLAVLDIEKYKLPVYLAFKKDVIDISKVNNVLLKMKAATLPKE
ncbi:substrate-binding periplasmic protein [Colwellia hornerae]|nr:ABC transporter substrate-binding protein [Colwellia hornerae]